VATLLVLFLLGAAVAGGDKQRADQAAVEKALQRWHGRWEQVSIESNGQKESFVKGMAPLFIIRGDRYTVEAGGKVVERGRLKLYPAANPRQSDLIVLDGTAQDLARHL
jgi:uncharacterized protein (TIGR03067 family)